MQPFSDFTLNLETFLDDLNSLIEKNHKTIADLLDIPEKTYMNFVRPFDFMEEDMELLFTPLSHINAVNNSDISSKSVCGCTADPHRLFDVCGTKSRYL